MYVYMQKLYCLNVEILGYEITVKISKPYSCQRSNLINLITWLIEQKIKKRQQSNNLLTVKIQIIMQKNKENSFRKIEISR